MEVRCSACDKLFRVSDEKITGAGIKFPCSKCKQIVKITKEDFEQYKLSQEAVAALASFVPKPQKTVSAVAEQQAPAQVSQGVDFDLSGPADAAASMGVTTEQALPSFGDFDSPTQEESSSQGNALDFDLGGPAEAAASMGSTSTEQELPSFGDFGAPAQEETPAPGNNAPDFDLSGPADTAASIAGTTEEALPSFGDFSAPAQEETSSQGNALDFDLSGPADAAASMGSTSTEQELPSFADFGAPAQEENASQGNSVLDFDLSGPADAAASLGNSEETPSLSDFGASGPEQVPSQGHNALDFDLSDPASAAASYGGAEETPALNEFIPPAPEPEPVQVEPAPAPAVKSEPKPQPASEPEPKRETAMPAPVLKPELARPAKAAEPVRPAAEPVRETPSVPETVVASAAKSSGSSGIGKKIAIVVALLLVIGAGAVAAVWYFVPATENSSDVVKTISSPDGLQILNPTAVVDPATNDIVVTGTIENMTDKPKPGWYCVVELFDVRGAVIAKGKMLNGKQFYSPRDFDILAKRGSNIQEIKTKNLQEQGVVIPAKASVRFEIRIMDPPDGVANFTPTLRPFDPVQLFRQMAAEQK